jgi:DNA-binding transcriptional MerR regulator
MFSLDQLSGEVTNRLAQLGMLGAAPDARVSASPDARTVRYYTTLGLLDRPRIENRQARYGQRHLLQLLVIKILQSQDLPLARIQELMYGRSDAELQQMIDSLPPAEEQTLPEPPALTLREVIVEPGLRIVADARWAPRDEAQLAKRIGAALRALTNGGKK